MLEGVVYEANTQTYLWMNLSTSYLLSRKTFYLFSLSVYSWISRNLQRMYLESLSLYEQIKQGQGKVVSHDHQENWIVNMVPGNFFASNPYSPWHCLNMLQELSQGLSSVRTLWTPILAGKKIHLCDGSILHLLNLGSENGHKLFLLV